MEKEKGDYQLFVTDILYTDAISGLRSKNAKKDNNGKVLVNITYNEEHLERSRDFYEHEDIFTKRYEWAYEKECRLVVKPSSQMWDRINKVKQELKEIENNRSYVSLRVFVPGYTKMRDRLIRSPIYAGRVIYGQASSMAGEVEWNL